MRYRATGGAELAFGARLLVIIGCFYRAIVASRAFACVSERSHSIFVAEVCGRTINALLRSFTWLILSKSAWLRP